MTSGRSAVGDEMASCFVIMGFGEKTDFQSNPQRVLNLNRTFEDIIQPALATAGVECIRADKIMHSSVIDKPMYENLLDADLVIADLSTSNANALYELGVRHALRPHATIVIAEDKFTFPFDLNHLSITKYVHMGSGIEYNEVLRMQKLLADKIAAILGKQATDSPVFLFLPQLLGSGAPPPAPMEPIKDTKSLAELRDSFLKAKSSVSKPADWRDVLEILDRIQNFEPNEPFLIQQRALATYKSEYPSSLESLRAARDILSDLKPDTSSDAETIGMWGAIHKRLWNVAKERPDLDRAIRSYARGYFIKDDHYNAINFAFLLNVRASITEGDHAIADRVFARRIRGEVLVLCDNGLNSESLSADDRYWFLASKIEALHGLGRFEESSSLRQQLIAEHGENDWRITSMNNQLQALDALAP
jgi:hypothetical protein